MRLLTVMAEVEAPVDPNPFVADGHIFLRLYRPMAWLRHFDVVSWHVSRHLNYLATPLPPKVERYESVGFRRSTSEWCQTVRRPPE